MTHRVVLGRRRYTCLSPHLVRIEFAPDGVFDDRRSMVAYAPQQPRPFARVAADGAWTVLDTGFLQLHVTDHQRPATRLNLEARWQDGKLQQFWRPGDPDYQNLGGTLRSLDRYAGESCRLDGVHPATLASPDPSGTNWVAWTQCEVDPLYEPLHPAKPTHLNRGHWAREVQRDRNDGRYLERTWNWYKDARKFCPGILSHSGYFLLNDSDGAVLNDDGFPVERDRPGYQDWYLFAYARDYRQALRDFRLLSGPAPLPTHRTFGIVFSRWPAFTEAEIAAMARDFAANGYPLSTLVMDMEWHKEGWGHWEFNPELIPDPAAFFAQCHAYGLEVTFNDHPLDVREDDCHFAEYVRRAGPGVEVRSREYNGKTLRMAKVDITDQRQNEAFRAVCHQPILDLGLDYWWNDGSRGQLSGTAGQLVCNHSSYTETERDDRRGMLFARYGGLGSHRYGAFFTGDANSDWEVLRLQVEFNIRAAGVGVSHVSHDIGGFMLSRSQLVKNAAGEEILDPERYLRWLQFGVFGPVLRFHSAPGCGSRLPYAYDSEVGGACRHWLRVRHRLLPYLYTAAREYHDTGLPLTRGLFLLDPENPAAYRWDQYWCGPALLVAPVVAPVRERTLYLPPGQWWAYGTGEQVAGGTEFTRPVALHEVPAYVPAGGILVGQDPDRDLHAGHVRDLWLDVYGGADGSADLYEDDGRTTAYRDGACCRTRFTLSQTAGGLTLRGEVVAGRPLGAERTIVIEFALATPPIAAHLDDGTPLALERLPEPHRFRLRLPPRPAAQPFAVHLH
jgi:alpha-glucosidase